MPKNIKPTYIDLFAGIGGFKLAVVNNGGICVGFSEIEKNAIESYCENFNINPDKTSMNNIKADFVLLIFILFEKIL